MGAKTLQVCMQDTIRREQLLSSDDAVLVAFSGGADSCALLHALCQMRDRGELANVKAAHVHHGLRGADADADEQAVRSLCAAWGVELFVHHADVKALAAAQKRGIEEMGRAVRYAFLQTVATEQGATIATAHTLNDQTETVLMHLARGCGLHGLCGIPYRRDNIVRPLLDCSREQVEDYCRDHSIDFVTDQTNADLCYARNRIRQTAVPALLSVSDTALQNVARSVALFREDDAYLESLATAFLQTNGDHPTATAVSVLAPPVRKRVLARLAQQAGVPTLSQLHRDQLSASVENGASVSVGADVTAVWQGKPKRLYFVGVPEPVEGETPLLNGENTTFAEKTYRFSEVSVSEWKKMQKIHKNDLNYAIDCDKIKGSLYLRSRTTGDYLHLVGRNGGKTVKKWMIECGLPSHLRDTLPVVCDEVGVVLVAKLGVDARVAVDENTNRIGIFENFQ